MTFRVALYARVSTQHQTQAQTIDQQLDRLQAYVRDQGWLLQEQHIFRDDGRSGANLNRSGLDHLRDAARAAEFDRVLVTEPDRLARNYVHQMIVLDELERFGCQVVFVDRPMSDDPHDRLLLQIRGAVAEYERTLIADRMRRGRQVKYRAGTLLPWSRPPYGYRLHPERPRDPSGLTIDQAEAAIIGEIYAWYVEQDSSLHRLAQHLQAQGVPTPTGKQIWSLCTLRAILRQPAYTGQIYAERFRSRPPRIRRSATHPLGRSHDSLVEQPSDSWIPIITIPAIISKELFERAQRKLAHTTSFATRHNTTHQYLLRALVSCGVCQSSCSARRLQTGHMYYVCAAKGNPIHTRKAEKCTSRFSPSQQLDELVWRDLCEVLTHPEQIALALERAQGGHWLPQELQARLTQLRQAHTRLSQQIERLTEAYLSEVIALSEYQRRRKELEQKQQALASQAEQLNVHVDRQNELAGLMNSVKAFCERVQEGLDNATFEQKRQLVELLIDRVIVSNGDVEIRYVIPTSPSSEYVRFCHLRSDYFTAPNMIRTLRIDATQQIRIHPMLDQTLGEIRTWCDTSDAHLAHIVLNPFAIDWSELLRQQHRELTRTIEGMRGIQLINPMFDRHFLGWWRCWLIVQAATTDAEKSSLGRERERVKVTFDKGTTFGMA